MHPPIACQVALKRVSILFNFTKTHSNLPDINVLEKVLQKYKVCDRTKKTGG